MLAWISGQLRPPWIPGQAGDDARLVIPAPDQVEGRLRRESMHPASLHRVSVRWSARLGRHGSPVKPGMTAVWMGMTPASSFPRKRESMHPASLHRASVSWSARLGCHGSPVKPGMTAVWMGQIADWPRMTAVLLGMTAYWPELGPNLSFPPPIKSRVGFGGNPHVLNY
jgi:hypothetical protein